MIEELINKPRLILCIDYGDNVNDYSYAVISLNYNNKNYVIYETNDKEQVKALDEIIKIESLKDEALQRIEAIDNASPSEALELIDSIREYSHSLTMVNYLSMNSDLDTIKQALLKSQEQEKVLSIIKEKNVDVCELKICIDEYDDSLYQYNKRMNIKQFKLTEQEFKLLKEVLCNE